MSSYVGANMIAWGKHTFSAAFIIEMLVSIFKNAPIKKHKVFLKIIDIPWSILWLSSQCPILITILGHLWNGIILDFRWENVTLNLQIFN